MKINQSNPIHLNQKKNEGTVNRARMATRKFTNLFNHLKWKQPQGQTESLLWGQKNTRQQTKTLMPGIKILDCDSTLKYIYMLIQKLNILAVSRTTVLAADDPHAKSTVTNDSTCVKTRLKKKKNETTGPGLLDGKRLAHHRWLMGSKVLRKVCRKEFSSSLMTNRWNSSQRLVSDFQHFLYFCFSVCGHVMSRRPLPMCPLSHARLVKGYGANPKAIEPRSLTF